MTTTTNPALTTAPDLYRALRRLYPRLGARVAWQSAKDELALRRAEADGRIRFRRVQDDEPPMAPEFENERDRARYHTDLSNGTLEVWGVIAEVPETSPCPHCGGPIEEGWESVASLWGIDVYADEEGEEYLRDVERDLAYEAGILGQTDAPAEGG